MKDQYPSLWGDEHSVRSPDCEIIASLEKLRKMHQRGLLGGETMPEDANPGLPRNSAENYHFFTLGMAMNYQRNSYALWKAATTTYDDEDTRAVFDPQEVVEMTEAALRERLSRYKLGLQPRKHTHTWRKIALGIVDLLRGDIRNVFIDASFSVPRILEFFQITYRRRFPYLGGTKICNYWLHVMERYTDARLVEREAISVAPDTHVINASIRLGLIGPEIRARADVREVVAAQWRRILTGTGIAPIDIHTPLWLWSRGGFKALR